MANQNFRVKNGLEVGSVEVVNSSGSVNTSSFPDSGVNAGTVGNTTTIPVITVDAKGLVTNIQSASVSGVSNYTYTSSNSTFVLSTGDGSNFAQTIPTANSSTLGLIKVGSLLTVNATGFINLDEGNIDHDQLTGFVSNEHIDHSTVSVTAGNGLSGGGDITATRTIAVVAGNTQVISNSSGVFIDESEIDIHNLSGYVANEHIDHSTVSVTAGDGLSGGGTIAATRTIDVVGNTGITANTLGVFTNDSEIVHDNLSGFVSNEHIDHSSVTLTAGNGLTGGGDITTNRSFAVVGNTALVSNSSGVHVAAGDGLTANSTDLKVTAGTGVTVNATGVHIGQDVSTTANVTFSDVIVSGNLTINGTQTTIDTNNLVVNDAIITVASGQTGVPALDAGIEVERGDSANALLIWDESQDRWIQKLAGGTEYVLHTKQHDIALGTDTSGNYIDDISAGNGIAVTHTPGEGSDPSIAVVANTGITSNSSGIFTNDSEIVHDNLSGFVANEHIDHSTVSVTAGNGLTGGGTIAATRTLAVGAGNGISVNSTAVAVAAGNNQVVSNSSGVFIAESNIDIHNLSGYVANENIDHSSVTLTAGNGLSGGGDITTNRSFAVLAGTGVVTNSTGVHANSAYIRGLISAGGDLSYDSGTGVISFTNDAGDIEGVTAGNGLTGGGTTGTVTVTVGAGDGISVNSTAVAVKANTGVVANSSGVFTNDSQIVHDSLSGFVANEHIDHSSVTLTAGNGLTGGGDITASRSFAVAAGNNQVVSNSTGVFINESNIDIHNLSGYVAGEHIDHATVSITAGNGLTGGGDISSTRSLAVVAGNTQLISNASGIFANQANFNHNALSNYVSNQHIDHSSVSITAGNGLSGGGTIAATRTINVVGNTGITANSTGVFTNDSQIVHDNLSGFVSNEHIDHSSVTLSAGNGLTGGGDITTNRSFAVGAGNGISVNSTAVAVSAGNGIASNATGVHVVGGTGVTSNSTGVHIGQSVGTSDNVTFADVIISGNLTVSGTQTTLNTTELTVNDSIITLLSGHSGAPALDAGLEINRGSSANALIYWDESNDRWTHKLSGGTEYVFHTKANDIVLGTDTSGNYIDNVTAGNGISVSHTPGEGSEPSIAVKANTGIIANSSGIFADASNIDHDNLSGFVANEHINHSSVSITAGNGLTGGGNITATRTLAVGAGNGISVNSTAVAVAAGNNQVVSNSTGVFINESNIDIHNLSGYVANENIDHSGVTLTAGNGLTGGGTIAASRSFAVNAGDGVVVNATGVHVAAGNGLDVNSTSLSINNSTIRGLFSAGGDLSYDSGTGQFSFTNDAGDIESVVAGNGLTGGGTTGDVTLNLGVGAGLSVNTTAVSVVPNTGITANSSGIFTNDSEIVHDNLSGFVANEHINHSSVTLTAGNGLTGGGDITASRSFAVTAGLGIASNSSGVHVVAGTGITSNATGVYADASGIDHDSLSGFVANEHINHSSVTLTAGNGLTGGGNITTSRSFAVGAGNGISVNSTAVAVSAGSGIASNATGVHVVAGNNQVVSNSTGIFVNESNLDIHNLSGYVANENIDHSSVSISAGNGLSGGGTIAATRTLAVSPGNNQVVSNSSGLFIAESNIDIHNLSGYVANENIDHSAVSITAGNGLSGGGNITASRTLAVAAGNNQVVSNSSGVFIAEGNIDIHNLSGYVANENIDHSTVSITAGSGLTGGGTIASTRTLTVGAGNGIVTNATAVSVGAGNGLSVNSSAVAVKANNGITSNSTGTFVKAGTGVTVNATGVHIGQSVGTTDDVTFNDVNVSGNLTISGTQTTVSTATLSVTDAIITVAKDQTGTPGLDAGIEVERGDSANALFYWDESTDRWTHKLAGGTEYAFHTKANAIALGTDTSGNYVDNVTAGNGITVTGSAGEGWEPAVAVNAQTGLIANSSGLFADASNINHDDLLGFVANEHINHTSVTLTAGNGLTGGGNIAASRSFAVVGGTGVTSNSSGVHIGQDVATGASVSFNDITIAANAVIEDLYDSSNRLLKVYDSGGSVVWG